jgi:uncharacterized protein YbjT (DUF2867 family)
MPAEIAAVIGATGLIGSHLVQLLQKDSLFDTVRLLVRRPISFQHPKLELKLVNFSDPESFKLAIDGSNTVFCAVGTTQKKVGGDQEAYRKVDYDIPVGAARFSAETGVEKFLLVSSVGASSKSNNFYLKLKGEVEDAVQQTTIRSISVFRPSLLLGNREENRPGEKIGQLLMPLLSFAMMGPWSKYKPIQASDVSRAMFMAAKNNRQGHSIYEYKEMQSLISASR